jgi:hypothetical protein
MFKKIFWHGLLSAILSSLAAAIYYRIYYFATEVDFSGVLGVPRIIGLCVLISMAAVVLNYALLRWLKRRGEIVFNLLLSLISFACVMVPIAVSLPLSVKSPELFPGLAVPMVFFPALAWFTVSPLFKDPQSSI